MKIISDKDSNSVFEMNPSCLYIQSIITCERSLMLVIVCGGLTFWVYCYNDNRVSMSVIGYDQHGHQVKQWELKGARYIWQINVDADKKW